MLSNSTTRTSCKQVGRWQEQSPTSWHVKMLGSAGFFPLVADLQRTSCRQVVDMCRCTACLQLVHVVESGHELTWLTFLGSFQDLLCVNPLRTIGSPVTHENWPMNWPDFATSPALLGWPARNRHTETCIHRFSHILRRPPVPVVWFMSESRAVANEHKGHKRTIPIISSSFWMTVVLKGLLQCNILLAV